MADAAEQLADLRTFLVTVAAVSDPSAGVRQVTVAGDDLRTFEPVGPDSFVYLLLPPPGQAELTIDQTFSWEQYAAMDPADQPVGAYYTVRRWRPERNELDLHLVLHEDPGPASSWAEVARPGDEVALWGPRTAWAPPPDTERYLLVADDTALPAAAAILESLPDAVPVTLVAETGSPATRPLLRERAGCEVIWVDRGELHPGEGTGLVDAVRALAFASTSSYVWGGGESRTMTAVRRHVRDELGFAAEQVSLLAYWRRADTASS